MTKILITGGAGFIGHHIVEHFLKNTDFEVIVLDCVNYAGNLNRLPDIDIFERERHRIRFVFHDLRAPITDTVGIQIGPVDYIIHTAAETHVDRSLRDALPFAVANVVGTTNLLEWIKNRQPGLRLFVQFSTDEVYGPAPEGVFFKEWDTMRPSNPYAASKAGADMMAFCFAHAFGIPIIITRTMNVVGERQHPEKFLPKTIRAVSDGGKIVLHGVRKDDISSRCWIHARNVSDALLFLLRNHEIGEMYHIVGEEKTVWEIADIIKTQVKGESLLETDVSFVDFHSARPGHDKRYAMSGDKLMAMGWKPPTDLEPSIRKTVDWTLKHRNWLT